MGSHLSPHRTVLRRLLSTTERILPDGLFDIPLKYRILAGLLFVFLLAAVITVLVFHHQIVETLTPVAEQITQFSGAFLIPSVLLILVSFPPLFGHELISILTGFIWGVVDGFLIVTFSTLIGESLLFWSFRYYFESKASEFRRHHEESYGILVQIIQNGGFPMILLIRLSAIPSHFSTPLFASIAEVAYRDWLSAAALSSFKFWVSVYLGGLLKEHQESVLGTVVMVITALLTIIVGGYIWYEYSKMRRLHYLAFEDQLELDQSVVSYRHFESPPPSCGKDRISEASHRSGFRLEEIDKGTFVEHEL